MLFHFKVDPIDVRVHLPVHAGGSEQMAKLVESASSILNVKEILMTTAADFQAGFARMNAATTAIAELIRALIAKQQAGGMTAEEETAVFNQFNAVADSLEAMAATPTDPVPVPVPPPVV